MTSNRRRAGVVVAWAAAATVGLAAVTGAATSIAFAEPTPAPSTSTSAKADKPDGKRDGRHLRRALAKRVQHGEAVVKKKDGSFVTLVQQRGTVTAVDGHSVTLKSEDGYSAVYAVNGDTRVRVDRAKGTLAGVKVGQKAVVVGVRNGSTVTARGLAVGIGD